MTSVLHEAPFHPRRRAVLAASGGLGASALVGALSTLATGSAAAASAGAARAAQPSSKGQTMGTGTIRTADGAEIFYKDWGSGPVVVLSHGWPLNGEAWEDQLFVLASNGYRAIAHDRRGHGRSSQTWDGNDMDTYADDLAALVKTLDLHEVVHVGHSTGGGEVARYIGRHGTARVKGAVLVSAITPTLMKSPANPNGVPAEAIEAIRHGVSTDRAQFYHDLAEPFFGANRPGSKVSQGTKDAFWRQCMFAGLKGSYDCIKAFSESVFTEDLKRFDKPTLVIHGSDDQICPPDTTSRAAAPLVRGAQLKIYDGAPHGLPVTYRDTFNADLLAFLRA